MELENAEEIAAYNERSLNTLSRSIARSSGQEQFVLIWVRCNYPSLQMEMVRQLRSRSAIPVRELWISATTVTLYGTIKEAIAVDPPPALMVLGLESAIAIQELLIRLNRERGLWSRDFLFPIVLWVNDDIWQAIHHFCPDFKTFAASATIKFSLPPDRPIQMLREKADLLFSTILAAGSDRSSANAAIARLSDRHRQELTFAIKDIERSGETLDPQLQASLEFMRGWNADRRNDLDSARQHYQHSLTFWQQTAGLEMPPSPDAWQTRSPIASEPDTGDRPSPTDTPALQRYGCLLFYLGNCWHREALLHPASRDRALQQAAREFGQCLSAFHTANRPDLMAKFINALAEVLQRQGEWQKLARVASLALSLHQRYPHPIGLARSHGFLAGVALWRQQWEIAETEALAALELLEGNRDDNGDRPAWHWAWCYHRIEYLLMLGRSRSGLGKREEAIAILETAKADLKPESDPPLYLAIVADLRSLYFQTGSWLTAFSLKQHHRAIAQQYGYCAFIGAQPLQPSRQPIDPAQVVAIAPTAKPLQQSTHLAMTAMGRHVEIDRAIERIGRNDYKLTIVHGPPGVGKSSFVLAGLVPALAQRAIGVHIAMPVVVPVNADWVDVLDARLTRSVTDWGGTNGESEIKSESATGKRDRIQGILDRLRENGDRNLLTVFLFDPIDEEFLYKPNFTERQLFYEFVRQCLNIPFVKAIFCLREESLPYLLAREGLRSVDFIHASHQNICYPLAHLSVDAARSAIVHLTQRSGFDLESDLCDRFVKDLTTDDQHVRSVLLQMVGIQLEFHNITTLQEYRQSGGCEKLLQDYLIEAIADCGAENESAVKRLLHSLTDEDGTCKIKTQAELDRIIPECGDRLDIILKILVRSAVLLRLSDTSDRHYQLVDRRFVPLVRQIC